MSRRILKFPSLSTSARPMSMFIRGILTLSNVAQPLSLLEYPNLGPRSPVLTPFKCLKVYKSRNGTIKQCMPYCCPSIINFAKTAACVVNRPKSPGHIFVDVSVGVFMMNSSVFLSRVAVVSSPITSEP